MGREPIDLDALGARVDEPAHDRATAVRTAVAARGLGRLGELAEWLAGTQQGGPQPLRTVRMVHLGSAPGEPTAALAAAHGVGVRGIADAVGCTAALSTGCEVADDEAEHGTGLLVLAGRGDWAAAAAVVAVLGDAEPVRVMPRGPAACAPRRWMADAARLRDLRHAVRGLRDQPGAWSAALGCVRLAAATGVLLAAAARRTPVIVDGLTALAAAAIARELAPPVTGWLQAADRIPEPAYELALTLLGLRPLLDLAAGQGSGVAGALAVPLLRAALTTGGAEHAP